MTSAPAIQAASASAYPILPLEGLERKRTASKCSTVGPAVTSRRSDFHGRLDSVRSKQGSSQRLAATSPSSGVSTSGSSTRRPCHSRLASAPPRTTSASASHDEATRSIARPSSSSCSSAAAPNHLAAPAASWMPTRTPAAESSRAIATVSLAAGSSESTSRTLRWFRGLTARAPSRASLAAPPRHAHRAPSRPPRPIERGPQGGRR